MKLHRVDGQVSAIINDSPLLLSAIYTNLEKYPTTFVQGCIDIFKSMNNLNFFLKRLENREYNEKGRNQILEQSITIDRQILKLLYEENVSYLLVKNLNVDFIVAEILALTMGQSSV